MANDNLALGTTVERLRNHRFLAGMPPAYLEDLASITKTMRFGGNEVILEEGEESARLYLIHSGHVALEISEVSRPFRVDVLGPGDEFGWSWALGNPNVYQVRAIDAVEAEVIAASDLIGLCETDNAFGYALMRRLLAVVAKRLQATRLTVIDMYLPAAKRAGA